MSVSTDGILVFGIEIEDSSEEHELCSSIQDDYDKSKTLEESTGAKLVHHCSYDYPMYILGLSDTCQEASRGYPVTVDVTKIAGLDENDLNDRLASAAKAYGIKFQNGRWLLASLWG